MKGRAALVAVLLTACSSATGSTTTGPGDVVCEQPPAAEIEATSTLQMTVEPNPARPREVASLSVSSEGLPEEALAGIDAGWQCWDGTQWVTTHVIYRGLGDNPGQTIELTPDFQIRVPSIGLALDQGHPIVIPAVGPGLYRIEDEIIVDAEAVPGFAFVEVVAG